MIELQPLANLISTGFDKNLSLLSSEVSTGEFNSLLLCQVIWRDEKDIHKEGCTGQDLRPSPDGSCFIQAGNESLACNIFDEYIDQPPIPSLIKIPHFPENEEDPPFQSHHELSEPLRILPGRIPFSNLTEVDHQGNPALLIDEVEGIDLLSVFSHPDGLEPPGSAAHHSFTSDPVSRFNQELFLIKSDQMKWTNPSPAPSESEKTELTFSLFEKAVSGMSQKVINPMDSQQEESQSSFQFRERGEGTFIVAVNTDGSNRSLPFFNRWSVPAEEGEPGFALTFEFMGEPTAERPNSSSTLNTSSSISLEQNSFAARLDSVPNGSALDFRIEPMVPEGELKTQSPSYTKAEPSEIYHQVGRKIAWSLQHGEERIRLTLDPPKLGNLFMEVRKEKEIVKALLWAENPVTKELLETHRMELRRILEADGFKLERFDVFVQQEEDRFMERREFSLRQETLEHEGGRDKKAFPPPESSGLSSVGGWAFSRTSSLIDRIV